MKPEAQRAEMTRSRIHYYGITNIRKLKRHEAKHVTPVELAYYEGEQEGAWGGRKPYCNPYPAGLRHNAYEQGYKLSDPMGNHHGSNI